MAISILPIRRNLKFNLNPAKALTWHRDGLMSASSSTP